MRPGVLLLAAAATGCGINVQVSSHDPLGVVGGFVLTAGSEAPIAGAKVVLTSGGGRFTAETDMQGFFSVPQVPAGQVVAQIEQAGFIGAELEATLGGTVGAFPLRDPQLNLGVIGLIKADGTFTVRVVDDGGAPAAGVTASLLALARYVVYDGGGPYATGSFTTSATSGADGRITFTGQPVWQGLDGFYGFYTDVLDIPQAMLSGSHTYRFLGLELAYYQQYAPVSDEPLIVLAGPTTPLGVLASDIDALVGVDPTAPSPAVTSSGGRTVAPGGPWRIVFNQAIAAATVRAQLTDELGKQATAQLTQAVSGNVLTLTPSSALEAGARFNLLLHVAAADLGASSNLLPEDDRRDIDTTAPFFVQPSGALRVVSADYDATARTVDILLSEPIGVGGGDTAPRSCVAFYETDLDGVAGGDGYQGEWRDDGSLICASTPAPGSDITRLFSLENVPAVSGMPSTGFSRRVRLALGSGATGGCKPAAVGCVEPHEGTRVHLVFGRQLAQSTFRKANGAVVTDDLLVTIPLP